jgi:hypothetical protein
MRLLKLTHHYSGRENTEYILPEEIQSFSQNYWRSESVAEVDACGYGVGAGWHPARCGQAMPCAEHGDLKCQCGAAASEACAFAGSQFVCGAPACAAHQFNCGRHS